MDKLAERVDVFLRRRDNYRNGKDSTGPADTSVALTPSPLWPLEQWMRSHYIVLVLFVSIMVVVNEVVLWGADTRRWDWLYVSGFGTWLAGVYFPLLLPDKLTETLTRLVNRGVLNDDGRLAEFLVMLHRKARRSALIGAVVFCVAMVAAWNAVISYPFEGYVSTVVLETIATVPVGLFAGRTLSYGLLRRRLAKEGFTLTSDPYHLDGAAGLRPIGAFYLYQSGLLAIPGIFLAAWWFLIPVVHSHSYRSWQEPYAGLLLIIVVCQIFAFVLPMLSFHRLMSHHKNQLLREADELSRRSARTRPDPAIHEIWRKRYALIESMTTWPMDVQIRRRFGLRNVLLLVPTVAQALGAAPHIQSVLSSIHKLLSG